MFDFSLWYAIYDVVLCMHSLCFLLCNPPFKSKWSPLQCRHKEHYGVSNYRRVDCLLNRLFRCRSKKTPKLRVIGLYESNSSVTGEFPAQRASNIKHFSIWWRHNTMFWGELMSWKRAPHSFGGISWYIFLNSDRGYIKSLKALHVHYTHVKYECPPRIQWSNQ